MKHLIKAAQISLGGLAMAGALTLGLGYGLLTGVTSHVEKLDSKREDDGDE